MVPEAASDRSPRQERRVLQRRSGAVYGNISDLGVTDEFRITDIVLFSSFVRRLPSLDKLPRIIAYCTQDKF